MAIERTCMWHGWYLWNPHVVQKEQSWQMRTGTVRRSAVNMFIHHKDVPEVFYPQSSTSFVALLTNEVSNLGDVYRVTLGTQFKPAWRDNFLPFRAKVKPSTTKRWYYVVIGFTGDRVAWEANYYASLKAGS